LRAKPFLVSRGGANPSADDGFPSVCCYLVRGVDIGHVRQVKAKDWLALADSGALPALLQLPHPGPCQPSLELDRQGPRVVVAGDPEHRSLPWRPPLLHVEPSPPQTASWGARSYCFRRCAIRVPLALCASGTLTRSRPAHSVVSREKPSKRAK